MPPEVHVRIARTLLVPLLALTAMVVAPSTAQAATTYQVHAACAVEDGSDPADRWGCYWDGTTAGNGVGLSFVVLRGRTADDGARVVYLRRIPSGISRSYPLVIHESGSWASVYHRGRLVGSGRIVI